MIRSKITIPEKRIAEFCQKYHIKKLSLFGSVLEKNFKPDSDVDVLIEFEPNFSAGFIRLGGMELELSQILNRKADLRIPAELSRYFRQKVLETATVQYAKE